MTKWVRYVEEKPKTYETVWAWTSITGQVTMGYRGMGIDWYCVCGREWGILPEYWAPIDWPECPVRI